jgi:Raf kinase inhibitor-like YbhB/YbcL family protein
MPASRLLIPLVASALVTLAATAGAKPAASPLAVSSPDFANDGTIPADHTCQAAGTSVPLQWSEPPPRARSLAIIVDDPDAPGGVYTHFVLFNVPPSTRSLPSEPAEIAPVVGGVLGRNSSGKSGFAPICPPSGRHHYRFSVLALDTMLPLGTGASADDVEQAAQGHIVARGQLTGIFEKLH